MTKMNTFICSLCLLLCTVASAAQKTQVNDWVLEAVEEMPAAGGYVLSSASPRNLRLAFSWDESLERLSLDAAKAIPSYCTTATYVIFMKVLQKYWASSNNYADRETLQLLVPQMDADGVRMWGRWNSNGPGTAKLFTDAALGQNFDDIQKAQAGDFLKIFWNSHVGKKERGHTVIFLDHFQRNGVEMIKFWGSNSSTKGYGIKSIPRSQAVRMLFSRLEYPENLENILTLPTKDDFLASMLSRESSWQEVKAVSGF